MNQRFVLHLELTELDCYKDYFIDVKYEKHNTDKKRIRLHRSDKLIKLHIINHKRNNKIGDNLIDIECRKEH